MKSFKQRRKSARILSSFLAVLLAVLMAIPVFNGIYDEFTASAALDYGVFDKEGKNLSDQLTTASKMTERYKHVADSYYGNNDGKIQNGEHFYALITKADDNMYLGINSDSLSSGNVALWVNGYETTMSSYFGSNGNDTRTRWLAWRFEYIDECWWIESAYQYNERQKNSSISRFRLSCPGDSAKRHNDVTVWADNNVTQKYAWKMIDAGNMVDKDDGGKHGDAGVHLRKYYYLDESTEDDYYLGGSNSNNAGTDLSSHEARWAVLRSSKDSGTTVHIQVLVNPARVEDASGSGKFTSTITDNHGRSLFSEGTGANYQIKGNIPSTHLDKNRRWNFTLQKGNGYYSWFINNDVGYMVWYSNGVYSWTSGAKFRNKCWYICYDIFGLKNQVYFVSLLSRAQAIDKGNTAANETGTMGLYSWNGGANKSQWSNDLGIDATLTDFGTNRRFYINPTPADITLNYYVEGTDEKIDVSRKESVYFNEYFDPSRYKIDKYGYQYSHASTGPFIRDYTVSDVNFYYRSTGESTDGKADKQKNLALGRPIDAYGKTADEINKGNLNIPENPLTDGFEKYSQTAEGKSVVFSKTESSWFVVDLGAVYNIDRIELDGMRQYKTANRARPESTVISFSTEKTNVDGKDEYNFKSYESDWQYLNEYSHNPQVPASKARTERFLYGSVPARYIKVQFTPESGYYIELSEFRAYGFKYQREIKTPENVENIPFDKSNGNDFNSAFAYYDETANMFKNMTSIHQMEPGSTMYVAVIHEGTGMFLRNNGHGVVTAIDFMSYQNVASKVNGTWKSGEMQKYVWEVYRDYGGAFVFRAPYKEKIPNDFDNGNSIDATICLTPNPEGNSLKSYRMNNTEEQRWNLFEVNEDGKVKYKIKSIFYSCYLHLVTQNNTVISDKTAADEWLIMPILHQNKNITYGYSAAAYYVPTKDRDDAQAQILSSVSSIKTGENLKLNESLEYSPNYFYSVFTNPEVMEASSPAAYPQLFSLKCDKNANTLPNAIKSDQFMLWEISSTSPSGLYLDVLNRNQEEGNIIGFGSTTFDNQGNAATRFFFFYSLNADGGYYISSPAYSGGTTDKHFATATMNENDTVGTFTGSVLRAGKFAFGENQRFWINTGDATMKAEIRDIVVELDENGNYVVIKGRDPLDSYYASEGKSYYYNSAYPEELPEPKCYYGYTHVGDDIKIVNNVAPSYRHYRKNKYNVTFKSGVLTSQDDYIITVDSETLLNHQFNSDFTVTIQGNNQMSNSVYYGYDFAGWSINGEIVADYQSLIKDLEKDLEIHDGDSVVFTANWTPNTEPIVLPTDYTRENYIFFGWGYMADGLTSNDELITEVKNITENTTVYGYWAGADVSALKDQRGALALGEDDLSILLYVCNDTTIQKAEFQFNGFTYEWYRVNKDGETKVENVDSAGYNLTEADRGCAIKGVVLYNGTPLEAAYSALIPSATKVHATAEEKYRGEVKVNLNAIEAGGTEVYTLTQSQFAGFKNNVIGAAFVSSDLSGVSYKLYGVIGDVKILILSNDENILEQIGDISRQGILFDSYSLEITNNTGRALTANDKIIIATLPRVYQLIDSTNSITAGYCETISDEYSDDCRAKYEYYDENEELITERYFYEGDMIQIRVPVVSGVKLSAGSYIEINGQKIYPTYSVGNNGVIYFDALNKVEYLIGRENELLSILFGAEDKTVVLNISYADNSKTSFEKGKDFTPNFGPLGAKLYKDKVQIRFGTVWYLDDLVTQNKWYRDEAFGSYVIVFNNLLKDMTATDDDFLNYLKGLGTDEANTFLANWPRYKSKKLENTEEGKALREQMLAYLEAFIDDWNKKPEAERTRKINFGSAAVDAPATYYYFYDDKTTSETDRTDEASKPFVEFSAVLSVKDQENRELICIPYASYVYDWNFGTFAPPSLNKNVYSFKAPKQVYTYNGVDAQLSAQQN